MPNKFTRKRFLFSWWIKNHILRLENVDLFVTKWKFPRNWHFDVIDPKVFETIWTQTCSREFIGYTTDKHSYLASTQPETLKRLGTNGPSIFLIRKHKQEPRKPNLWIVERCFRRVRRRRTFRNPFRSIDSTSRESIRNYIWIKTTKYNFSDNFCWGVRRFQFSVIF